MTPQQREQAIDVIKNRLLKVTIGHTEQEALEVATAMVDQATANQDDDGHAG